MSWQSCSNLQSDCVGTVVAPQSSVLTLQQQSVRQSSCRKHAWSGSSLCSHLPATQRNAGSQSASRVQGGPQDGPQSTVPPQPSEIVPPDAPTSPHVRGVQPHTFGTPPPPQVFGVVQAPPQLKVPPQPFGAEPQSAPPGHDVNGVQPQTFAVPPPPQVLGDRQMPQLTVPPHPSGIEPQPSPAGHTLIGVQPHTFGVPPPPHVLGDVQEPQSSASGQVPSGIVPQVAPCAAHVVCVQHVPNKLVAGFLKHSRLQQPRFVKHALPSRRQSSSAPARGGRTPSAAIKATRMRTVRANLGACEKRLMAFSFGTKVPSPERLVRWVTRRLDLAST